MAEFYVPPEWKNLPPLELPEIDPDRIEGLQNGFLAATQDALHSAPDAFYRKTGQDAVLLSNMQFAKGRTHSGGVVQFARGLLMAKQQLVKVHFELDPDDWHGHGGEFLWASPTGVSSGDEFQILNSPCFTRGISFNDVVKAVPSSDTRTLEFEKVVTRSGHSTYMLLVEPDTPKFQTYWKTLEERGCSYESGSIGLSIGQRDLYSVDVPPSADIHEVHRILEKGESDGAWEYQDGYVHLAK